MKLPEISTKQMKLLLQDQQDEITAHYIYTGMAGFVSGENAEIIKHMAADELKHYAWLKEITGADLQPEKAKVAFYYWISRIFGITFGIKLLERDERQAVKSYVELDESLGFMDGIVEDEKRHERELIEMIDEERLNYMGSVVLGLNDALVELTGALAGYTFAFQDSRLISLTGIITGISASFSMAASEYLSTRHEGGNNALKSSVYTGLAYIFTVVFLVLPFILISNPFVSLAGTLATAVLIIFVFNYYISVARDYDFRQRFLEMAAISLGVAGISFFIGVMVKKFIGIDL